MTIEVDECPAAGTPESLRLPKTGISLLEVELSRATFVQKSEGFEVFRRKLVGGKLHRHVVRPVVRVAAVAVGLEETLLLESRAATTDPSRFVAGVPSDVTRCQFGSGLGEKAQDGLVGRLHPSDLRIHIVFRHYSQAKSIPFIHQLTGLWFGNSGTLESVLYKLLLNHGIALRQSRASEVLSSEVLLQKRGDTPGLSSVPTEPGALPYRTMSDARQPRKFSGSVAESPEIGENEFSVTLDLDNLNQNQLLSVETGDATVAMWVDGDARREDVVDVLEDLAAEAEYLAGGRDA